MRMNEFEYVKAKDATSTVPNLEPSDDVHEPPDDNSSFRIDMLLLLGSLDTAVRHIKTLMQMLADDDNELCGKPYKAARDNGLTL